MIVSLAVDADVTYVMTHPRCRFLRVDFGSVYNLVTLDVINLRHLPDPLNYTIGEHPRVAFDVPIIHMTNARCYTVFELKFVRLMSHCQKVEMVLHDGLGNIVFEHNDIRVVDSAMGVVCIHERCERQRRTLAGNIVRRGRKRV